MKFSYGPKTSLFWQAQPVEIVCQISKAGDDQYTMNKSRVHRKYITNLAKAYGIETGNLCQFLAQDTVREFPELSPQMIFKSKGLSLN